MLGDQDNELYFDACVNNIARAAEEFNLDAVHLDAASFYQPYPHDKLFRAVKAAIGDKRLIACEYLITWEEFKFHALMQKAEMDLVMGRMPAMLVKDVASLPAMEGLREHCAWLDKLSPVCDFVKDCVVYYPHLCAADGFVPVGKVCNVLPPRKLPSDAELWHTLRDAKRLRYVPGLRVNYRAYGLDAQTAKALEELTR